MGLSALAVLGAVGLVAVIGYQFIGISVLCDEYLCPALDEVCEKLKMPRSLAGATLVAFGSSAPEVGSTTWSGDTWRIRMPSLDEPSE